ncbi:acyltransferase family protein [Brucella grignonensis]|uniref:Acyltransferase family protein n=1 Tax=Brucella grignonensis TaxID=94627 RepID=A0A256FD11_9HYPH|nr:acyltransferase [Brucella grignonensis]OYR12321.1 acyltransferase family protein [Brucella grignonensis]
MSERLDYLDGLRGLAALAVVFSHFESVFSAAISSGGQYTITNTLKAYWFLSGGNFAVCIFFVLSGYVLILKYDKRGGDALSSGALKRYLRLTPAILASAILLYLIQTSIGFYNSDVAQLIGGHNWLASSQPPQISFFETIKQGLTVIFHGQSPQNGVLWTMRIEFLGSMILFGLCSLFYKSNFYGIISLLFSVFLISYYGETGLYVSLFIAGSYILKRKNLYLFWPLIFAALYLGSFRAWDAPISSISNSFYWKNFIGIKPDVVIHAVGAIILVLSIRGSEIAKQALSLPVCSWLGRISFSLYLIHFTVFSSLGCLAIVKLSPLIGVQSACVVGLSLTLIVTFALSEILTRTVDLPSQKLADGFARFFLNRPSAQQSISPKNYRMLDPIQ